MGVLNLEQFFKRLDREPRNDYIVRLAYKYNWEKEYTVSNEILEYDGEHDYYIWLNDWDEGQQDVKVLGYICIDEVDVPEFT